MRLQIDVICAVIERGWHFRQSASPAACLFSISGILPNDIVELHRDAKLRLRPHKVSKIGINSDNLGQTD